MPARSPLPPLFIGTFALFTVLASPSLAAAPQLKVSDNHRFLVYADGRPFFYLGDTANLRTRANASSCHRTRTKTATGCWCSTTRPEISHRRVPAHEIGCLAIEASA